MNRRLRQSLLPLVLFPFAAACGVRQPSNTIPAPAVETAPLSGPITAGDGVESLIARSDALFREGERELAVGHVEGARLAFNAALGVLLESEYGGRTETRLREHFDRLVDRISAYELRALAEGDGFTELEHGGFAAFCEINHTSPQREQGPVDGQASGS